MAGSTAHLHSELARVVGKEVVRISRVLFEHSGELEENEGALELWFADASVLLMDSEADGERVRLCFQPWRDPFEGPLSEENQKYIEQCGRWRRVECSKTACYSDLIGRTLNRADLLENELGTPAGVAVTIEGHVLWFTVSGDESRVHWAQPIGFRRTNPGYGAR